MALSDRNPEGLAVGDIDPRSGRAVVAITTATRQQQENDRQNQALDLNQRQFTANESQRQFSNEMAQHQAALDEAQFYYKAAAEVTALQDATKQKLDAADFLTHAQDIHHDDPEFENKFAALAAKYPRAGADAMVQNVLASKSHARQVMNEATKSGGAYAFEDGPARQEYQNVFKNTGDVLQAHGAATQVAAGETMVNQNLANGFLKAEDFDHNPDNPSKILNPDGTINYSSAAKVAAGRSGEVAGKNAKALQAVQDRATKQEDFGLQQALDLTKALAGVASVGELTDDQKELMSIAASRILKSQKSGAVADGSATATPTPGQTPPPNKPKLVKQGGVTYTLQPDGSYK